MHWNNWYFSHKPFCLYSYFSILPASPRLLTFIFWNLTLVSKPERSIQRNMQYLSTLWYFFLACLLVLLLVSVILCYLSLPPGGPASSLRYLAEVTDTLRFLQLKLTSTWNTHGMQYVAKCLAWSKMPHLWSHLVFCLWYSCLSDSPPSMSIISLLQLFGLYLCFLPFPFRQLISVQFHPQMKFQLFSTDKSLSGTWAVG